MTPVKLNLVWLAALLAMSSVMSTGCIIQRGPLMGVEGDAGTPSDVGSDAFDAPDARVDAPSDAGIDANDLDGGPDAAIDADLDAPLGDAGSDAGSDAGADGGSDAGLDAGVMADAGSDAGSDAGMDAAVSIDAALTPDAGSDAPAFDAGRDAPLPDAFCAPSFCSSANTLSRCAGGMITTVTCPLGCFAEDETRAHCGVMIPTHVPEAQLLLSGLAALNIPDDQGLIFHTDTGQIQRRTSSGVDEIRMAGAGTIAGIDFRVVTQAGSPAIGSFAMASFDVAERGQVRAVGDAALAILSQGPVTIAGNVDVGANNMGTDALVGGPGGYDAESGPGAGGRAETDGAPEPGGGGGGFGGRGGNGDDDTAAFDTRSGGEGGVVYGDAPLTILQGGSGGGQGENGRGGGGGGAVQITSLVSIAITGIIMAPGEGGRPDQQGAGGGGAGGAIFLEAPSVTWTTPGILAVNGGGGGGGNTFTDNSGPGERGQGSSTAAVGGVSDAFLPDGRGGAGAAGASNVGGNGTGVVPSGGGGGGGGRIRVLTLSGFAPGGLMASPSAALSAGPITVR